MKTVIAVILIVVGLVCVAGGIIYFTQPAHSLPSFFPSHTSLRAAGANIKHTKKGLVAVVVGAVLLLGGLVVAAVARRPTAS
ncbi:MAG TPA: hypothetical protein DCQ30_00165 [Acidimicrobiaceae bacterium]|nr:hypothetical protein [Acidimicrobiaceae bacterium]